MNFLSIIGYLRGPMKNFTAKIDTILYDLGSKNLKF